MRNEKPGQLLFIQRAGFCFLIDKGTERIPLWKHIGLRKSAHFLVYVPARTGKESGDNNNLSVDQGIDDSVCADADAVVVVPFTFDPLHVHLFGMIAGFFEGRVETVIMMVMELKTLKEYYS